MKLLSSIASENHEIKLRQQDSQLTAEIDGRLYELEADEVEPNVFLLKHQNHIFQVYVSPSQTSADQFEARVGDNIFAINLADPKRLRSAAGAGAAAGGAAEIKTAMPGKIVRILVEAGAEIEAGTGVLIVEAMKMQNEMKSPRDGTVKEIRVVEGATVNAGEILAVIE